MSIRIHRCANCGAPLEGAADVRMAACLYCRVENHIGTVPSSRSVPAARSSDGPGAPTGNVERFQLAAREAEDIAKSNEARGEALMADFKALSTQAHMEGDRAAAEQAVIAMEGYMRLQYAPTVHLYNSWDPNDPQVVAAMEQIDAAIESAIAGVRSTLNLS